jgi:hypothetical protein
MVNERLRGEFRTRLCNVNAATLKNRAFVRMLPGVVAASLEVAAAFHNAR